MIKCAVRVVFFIEFFLCQGIPTTVFAGFVARATVCFAHVFVDLYLVVDVQIIFDVLVFIVCISYLAL